MFGNWLELYIKLIAYLICNLETCLTNICMLGGNLCIILDRIEDGVINTWITKPGLTNSCIK